MPELQQSSRITPNTSPWRIDAHHHLWRYNAQEYAWITEEMATIRCDFVAEDLYTALDTAQVDAAVAVQARQSLEETEWLLGCAKQHPRICGVVGWLPLDAANISGLLDKYNDIGLCGLRHIVQAEPDGFLDAPAFNHGIACLTARGLAYDVLVYERQLAEAIRFVDRHPQQRFVVDHAAKPRIAASELEPWASSIRELAKRPNVHCKLSGLVTEADWKSWTLDALRPYLDVCVEAFGMDRLLAGSDWPVCLLATSYSHWWNTLDGYFSTFSEDEKQKVFGANAAGFYHLHPASKP